MFTKVGIDRREREWSHSVVSDSDLMDCSPPGSSVHGIFQARVLEWVAISFFRGSSQPRGWTLVSRIASRHFTIWATREAPLIEEILQRKEKRRRNTSELILENNKCPPEKLFSFFRHVWGYLSSDFVWIFSL